MAGLSIRLRLTIWYSVVLLAGLAILGGSFWFSLHHILLASLDGELQQLCRGAVSLVQDEGREGASLSEFRAELDSYAASAPKGRRIEVRGPAGELIYQAEPGTANGRYITLTLAAPVRGRDYQVTAGLSRDSVDGLLRHFLAMLSWAAPATLLLASLGGYWISRRALAPVDAITAAARSIGIRNLSQRLVTPGTGDELQRLSETWNEMLERLESAVKRLNQFTADASHELRTPIALIRTTAELALRRDRTAEEYREALSQIQAESERTSDLIADLLTLARADAGQGTLPLEPVDLVPLVREVCDQGSLLAGMKLVPLVASLPDASVLVDANTPALRRLLLILLDNAVKYTAQGGTIKVSIGAGPPATITVEDSGVGIAEDVLPHIFERFYRADPARSRDSGGSGLGLSIAHWIAEMHGAEIGAGSVLGKGAVFQLRFLRTMA